MTLCGWGITILSLKKGKVARCCDATKPTVLGFIVWHLWIGSVFSSLPTIDVGFFKPWQWSFINFNQVDSYSLKRWQISKHDPMSNQYVYVLWLLHSCVKKYVCNCLRDGGRLNNWHPSSPKQLLFVFIENCELKVNECCLGSWRQTKTWRVMDFSDLQHAVV